MKTPFINHTLTLLLAVFFLFTNSKCKKANTDNFCNIERTGNVQIDKNDGMVVYSNKYQRYGISFSVTDPDNIDSQIVGLVCNLPKQFQKVGLEVTISGTLKNFNSDEHISPEIAGQDLRFFEISQINNKQ